MQNKKLIRFVEAFVLFAIAVTSMPGVALAAKTPEVANPPQTVLPQKLNIAYGVLSLNNSEVSKTQILKAEGDAIDAYFTSHNMPLAGYGLKMATEADKNDLDWRLLPAISARESTGGRHDCIMVDHNPFGWASCKVGFKSLDRAIEIVARNLGGNNPKTAMHYDNKSTLEILHVYNPPAIVPHYAEQVMKIMNDIGPTDILGVFSINS